MGLSYLKDPKTKEESVSLTLLVVSAALLIVAGGLEMFGVISNTSIFDMFFYSNAGLYFGRRVKLSKESKEIENG